MPNHLKSPSTNQPPHAAETKQFDLMQFGKDHLSELIVFLILIGIVAPYIKSLISALFLLTTVCATYLLIRPIISKVYQNLKIVALLLFGGKFIHSNSSLLSETIAKSMPHLKNTAPASSRSEPSIAAEQAAENRLILREQGDHQAGHSALLGSTEIDCVTRAVLPANQIHPQNSSDILLRFLDLIKNYHILFLHVPTPLRGAGQIEHSITASRSSQLAPTIPPLSPRQISGNAADKEEGVTPPSTWVVSTSPTPMADWVINSIGKNKDSETNSTSLTAPQRSNNLPSSSSFFVLPGATLNNLPSSTGAFFSFLRTLSS